MRQLLFLASLLPVTTGCWLAHLTNTTQLTGSGNVVTQTYDFIDFDSVQVGNSFQAELIQGDIFAVEVQADDNLMPHLDLAQEGVRLKVRLKPGSYRLRNVTLRALITMPNVSRLDASGASRLALESVIASEPLTIDASGASKITGDIDCPSVKVDASGASRIELSGTAGAAQVEASGASTAELSGLNVKHATVEVSGASKARLFVDGHLDADASGASTVEYRGNPELGSIKKSGASSIKSR